MHALIARLAVENAQLYNHGVGKNTNYGARESGPRAVHDSTTTRSRDHEDMMRLKGTVPWQSPVSSSSQFQGGGPPQHREGGEGVLGQDVFHREGEGVGPSKNGKGAPTTRLVDEQHTTALGDEHTFAQRPPSQHLPQEDFFYGERDRYNIDYHTENDRSHDRNHRYYRK